MLREGDQRSIVSGSEEGVLQELMDSASGKIFLDILFKIKLIIEQMLTDQNNIPLKVHPHILYAAEYTPILQCQ